MGGFAAQGGLAARGAAGLISGLLLLLGVIAGVTGVASAAGVLSTAQAAGSASSGSTSSGSTSSSSSVPVLAAAGTRSTPLAAERRHSSALTAPGSSRKASGGGPLLGQPLGVLPSAGWQQPAHLVSLSIGRRTTGVAVAVPTTQQSRAPPAGSAPL